MRCRGFFVGLTAALMAVTSIIIIAGPAGAVTNACIEDMNPAGQGNASGLTVACTFVSGAAVGLNFTLTDAYDATSDGLGPASGAIYHYGAARIVNVTATRTGAAPGVLTGANIISCATNNTTAAVSSAACPAPGALPGNLAFSAADINHSVEFATSSATLTGQFINPGSFVKAVAGTTVTLSKPLITAGAPACPGTYASGCKIAAAQVLVSNGTNRATTDMATTAGSGVITSATAHFCGGASTCTAPSDIGARVSGGDLPDGATIASVQSLTQVTLTCTGCIAGFASTTSASGQAMSIDPATPPTSTRYAVDVTTGGTGGRTLTSATAKFASTDVGMPVVFNPAVPALLGARIGSVSGAGSTAVLVAGGAGTVAAGANKKITIGKPTKTAPANGDVTGTLAIALVVNPAVSPTSPPCAANKVSGFHIPWQWKNPGSYALADNNSTHVEGHGLTGTSIAQFLFNTASTSFAGFVKQAVTVGASAPFAPTTQGYTFRLEFAPVAVGVCSVPTVTPVAETLSIIGISVKQAANPTFTGGGGGGTRALGPIPDGQTVHFGALVNGNDGGGTADGVRVVTQGSDPTDDNYCDLSSPNVIKIGCRP